MEVYPDWGISRSHSRSTTRQVQWRPRWQRAAQPTVNSNGSFLYSPISTKLGSFRKISLNLFYLQ